MPNFENANDDLDHLNSHVGRCDRCGVHTTVYECGFVTHVGFSGVCRDCHPRAHEEIGPPLFFAHLAGGDPDNFLSGKISSWVSDLTDVYRRDNPDSPVPSRDKILLEATMTTAFMILDDFARWREKYPTNPIKGWVAHSNLVADLVVSVAGKN